MNKINTNLIIGILGNFQKEKFYEIFNELGSFLKNNNIDFYLLENNRMNIEKIYHRDSIVSFNEIIERTNIVISIGGDGTIISSIRKFLKYDKPILGLHIGGLGFLAECSNDNFKEKILDIKNGNYYIEDRMLLNVNSIQNDINHDIINELVIDRRDSARTVKTNISISGKFANTYESDGIIISTPTGSTAYSLSAGGPIVYPSMELTIITPICPHTLSMRPLIIPSYDSIDVNFDTSENKKLSLTVDGQIQEIINNDSEIIVKKSEYSAHLIKFNKYDYFHTLRDKMYWKGNLRIK